MLNRNGSSSTSSHLEFSADWSHARSSMGSFLARTKTEISFSFSISWASQQQDVFASWRKLRKLIESQAASLSSGNSISGSLGKPEGHDSESLRNIEESDIVGDSADNGDYTLEFVITLDSGWAIMRKMFNNAWNGDGVTIESWLVKAFVDDLVKFRISSSW